MITNELKSGMENTNYFLYILVMIGLVIGYMVIRPTVKWFIEHRVFDLLSYLFISLLLFVIVFGSYFLLGLQLESLRDLLKVLLQVLACFGVGLVLWNLIRVLFIKQS